MIVSIRIVAASLLLLSVTILPAQSETNIETEVLVAPCFACHGPGGISQSNAPTIAGMSERYLNYIMRRYRQGKAGSTIMNRMAPGYTKEQTKKVAAYFSSLPYRPLKQKFDKDLAAKGKQIHLENCEVCHNKIGTSRKNARGFLAGQRQFYLKTQMKNFLSGARRSGTMKTKLQKAGGLSAIDALVNYYSSIRPK